MLASATLTHFGSTIPSSRPGRRRRRFGPARRQERLAAPMSAGMMRPMMAVATDEQLRFIDLATFERTRLETDPFPYLIVPGFVPPAARPALSADYPKVE